MVEMEAGSEKQGKNKNKTIQEVCRGWRETKKIRKGKTMKEEEKNIRRCSSVKICVIIFTSNMLCLIYEFILIINYNHLFLNLRKKK